MTRRILVLPSGVPIRQWVQEETRPWERLEALQDGMQGMEDIVDHEEGATSSASVEPNPREALNATTNGMEALSAESEETEALEPHHREIQPVEPAEHDTPQTGLKPREARPEAAKGTRECRAPTPMGLLPRGLCPSAPTRRPW